MYIVIANVQVALCTVHCIKPVAIACNKFLVSFQQCVGPENTPPPPPQKGFILQKNSDGAKGLKGNKIKEMYGDKFESSEGWGLLCN